MKNLRPYHTLLFTLGIFGLLIPLVIYIPNDGWHFGKVHFRFLSYDQFIHPIKADKANVDSITQDSDTAIVEENLVKYKHVGKGNLGAPVGGVISVKNATNLEFNDVGLERLSVFFNYIDQAAKRKEKVGLIHFGDSQIEGDRMTNFIRQRLQEQFGGFGPGVIPATNVYNTNSFLQDYSDNFVRYTSFGREGLKSDKYGGIGSVSRFTEELKPSVSALEKMSETTGWIEVEPSLKGYPRVRIFNNITLHYTDCIAPVKLTVYQNDKVIHDDYLIADSSYHAQKFGFDETPGKLKFQFTGKVSPNICGFSLEGDYGVQVTNVGMRGSSGMYFWKQDYQDMKAMYEEMNTKLVILQFGGNQVPYFKDSSDVDHYARNFKSQVNYVRKIIPDAVVVAIGPSDMSDLVNGIRVTYKFIPYCIEQMKKVTVESGGVFWDLYSAMGGHNSMPAWVEKNLAAQDYIHFSNAGAKIASQMFYEAFIAEFVKWKGNN